MGPDGGARETERVESSSQPREPLSQGRRGFLLLAPLGIMAGMVATIAAAALRFLRPADSATGGPQWTDVMPVTEISGQTPILRRVTIAKEIGWTIQQGEESVYVLPGNNRVVLSSICPHEGCNVVWQDETHTFVCPCHDSTFAPGGERLGGPSRRGLDPLQAREQNGVLQVRYASFVNNIPERVERL